MMFQLSGICGYAYYFDANSKEALDKIAAFQFDKAREQIALAKKLNPTNNIPYWAENYIDFLILLNGEEETQFKQFIQNRPARLKRLGEGSDSSPYKRFCQAEVLIQWAFVRIKFKQYLTAFREIDKAYSLLEENNKLFPNFAPNKAGMGVLHVLIGSVPESYSWITDIVGYEGTVEQGLAELNEALRISQIHSDFKFLETECTFFLAFLYLNLESARETALTFRNNYLKDRALTFRNLEPVQAYAVGKISLQLGLNDDALIILGHRKSGDGRYDLNYLDYMHGQAYLNKLSDSSRIFFNHYINYFKGRNFVKSAYQRIAWSYLIEGDTSRYRLYINSIKLHGNLDTDSDKQAQREAGSGEIPNPFLLKARFLCDGGYYDKSMIVLDNIQEKHKLYNSRDVVEYSYRKARVYDESGNKKQAVLWYRKTMLQGDKLPYYFAANAALKLGAIYELAHEYDSAAAAYKACLKMDYDEYKNGISQKAEIALERVAKNKNRK